MNNKQLGSKFERDFCKVLARLGYWVHFIAPDARGAQPFDVIAVKDGKAYAFDCKTSSTHRFNVNRIEDNQHMAFMRWIKCGNGWPQLAVLYDDDVYLIPYHMFSDGNKVIDLDYEEEFVKGFKNYISQLEVKND